VVINIFIGGKSLHFVIITTMPFGEGYRAIFLLKSGNVDNVGKFGNLRERKKENRIFSKININKNKIKNSLIYNILIKV